ncbi:MAG: hypothetical protein LBC27_00945, partial [Spirochaetaceae bacterium]|nr:hypothetical protein [Spirochaetaceae bacterium]
ENRAFRGYALSRSGHIAPAGGAVSASHPYNRLRSYDKSQAVVSVIPWNYWSKYHIKVVTIASTADISQLG